MSASAAAADTCPNCGVDLPPAARFCPSCGSRVDPGATVKEDLPLHEDGPVPVSVQRTEPRLFGVAPPHLMLGIAVVAIVVALVLFATGSWPYGLIMLGIGALLLAGFLEAARRRPSSVVTRASVDARERARTSWETLRARQAAAVEVKRIQSLLIMLESDRRSTLHELGVSVHAADGEAEARARERLAGLDEQEEQLRGALDRALEEAGERIRRARLPVEETMMVLPSEPTPPPDEANPPEPARIPEPYPPPDEADPPQPARIPEPGPRED
jgi:hypothetical protein